MSAPAPPVADEGTLALVQALEDGTLAELDHAAHVRVAWHYVRRLGLPGALARLSEVLARYAASKGRPDAYHETITFAFASLIHERVRRDPDAPWPRFAAACPELFERELLGRYYAPDVLGSDLARRVFVLPGPGAGR